MLPRVIDSVLGTRAFDRVRAEVCVGLRGDVLELGFGSGPNLPHLPSAVTGVWAVEPSAGALRLADDRLQRDAVIESLFNDGIGVSVHYIPLHLHPYWRERYGLREQDFPVSQHAYERMISLPMYSRMGRADVERTRAFVDAYTKAYGGNWPNFMGVGGYDGMQLIYKSIEATKGSTDGTTSDTADTGERPLVHFMSTTAGTVTLSAGSTLTATGTISTTSGNLSLTGSSVSATTLSSTSGFTSAGSRSAVEPVRSVWNSRSMSTTTSVSNWLLPLIPPTQQMRSVNFTTPRVSATSMALRSCAMRWFENVRTWIVSANAFSSSPGCTGLRVTRMVLSRDSMATLAVEVSLTRPSTWQISARAPGSAAQAARSARW